LGEAKGKVFNHLLVVIIRNLYKHINYSHIMMNLRNLVNKDSTLEDLDALAKTPFKIDGVDYLLVGNLEELVKEARGKKEGDSHAAIVGTRVFFVWLYNHLNLQREFNEEENQTYRTIMAANVKRADKRFEYEQNLRRFKEPEKLFHEMMDPVNDECISALRILNGRFPLRFSELLKAEEILSMQYRDAFTQVQDIERYLCLMGGEKPLSNPRDMKFCKSSVRELVKMFEVCEEDLYKPYDISNRGFAIVTKATMTNCHNMSEIFSSYFGLDLHRLRIESQTSKQN